VCVCVCVCVYVCVCGGGGGGFVRVSQAIATNGYMSLGLALSAVHVSSDYDGVCYKPCNWTLARRTLARGLQ
jgi:hypothetical protein